MRSINLIEQVIESTDEFTISYLKMMEDIVFQRIPENLRARFIDFAIKVGRQTAEQLAKDFGTKDPIAIADSLGVKVANISKENVLGTIILRSEYLPTLQQFSYMRAPYHS